MLEWRASGLARLAPEGVNVRGGRVIRGHGRRVDAGEEDLHDIAVLPFDDDPSSVSCFFNELCERLQGEPQRLGLACALQ
jgi:hypothetical protein